jgi:hypothetical protein
MFNATTFVGTCKAISETWSSMDNYNSTTSPTSFCNAGIYSTDDANVASQSNFGDHSPQDSIVYTATESTLGFSHSQTQCYYCKDASKCTATCDTQYKFSNSFRYNAARFCPCDGSCQLPTSIVTSTTSAVQIKPVAIPTETPSLFPTSKK